MKKLIFTVAAGLAFIGSVTTNAQGLFLGAGGGYGLASGVQQFPNSPSVTTIGTTTSSTTYTSQTYSFGSGVNAGIYVGYMFGPNIGIQLGVSDKFAYTNTATESSTGTGSTSSDVYTLSNGMLMITPALRLKTNCDGKIQGYTVTGLIIGLPNTAMWEDKGTGSGTGYSYSSDEKMEISGGMTIGFHGALGGTFMFSDKIGIFAEIFANLQNWAPDKSVITAYNGSETSGGVTTPFDYLTGVNTTKYTQSQIETDFVSSYTSTNPPPASAASSPTQSLKTYLPFSSVGITVGIHFDFGGGSSATPAK